MGVTWMTPGTVSWMCSTSSSWSRTWTPAFAPPACSLVRTGKDADHVGAELREDRLKGMAEARAVGQQEHDRGDAPGHADDRDQRYAGRYAA